MSHLTALLLSIGVLHATTSQATLSQKRETLKPQVLITTISPDELARQAPSTTLEHDTEVSRSEAITIVLTIAECAKAANGSCNASADVVAYKPDGSVHSGVKNLSLNNKRVTAPLKLVPNDVIGLYKVVATVRDLNAGRFGSVERIFGVK